MTEKSVSLRANVSIRGLTIRAYALYNSISKKTTQITDYYYLYDIYQLVLARRLNTKNDYIRSAMQ